MKNKIITAFLTVFFIVVILNLNNVFGIGTIGHSWRINSNGEYCLIFRTYTAPHESLIAKYHNTYSTDYVEGGAWQYTYGGSKYTSKWIDLTTTGYSTPEWYEFETIGFVFHTDLMGNYSSTEKLIGYNKSSQTIGSTISSIQEVYNNSWVEYTKPATVRDYESVKFFELMKSAGTYSAVDWGTGLTISNISHANYIEYRYAIVDIGGYNVIINDYIVPANKVKELIQAAKDNNRITGSYISNIVTSAAVCNDSYKSYCGQIEVARTVERFFSQYVLGYSWGNETRGLTGTKALGSVANLYDNEIYFPKLSKRSVMVRHINLGKNTTISTEIINNASIIASNDNSISVTNPEGAIGSNNTATAPYSCSEYYPEKLDMEQGVSDSPNNNANTYRYIGNNVAVGKDWSTAINSINAKISNGEFQKSDSVSVAGKGIMDETDYIVIDFYYTEYQEDVEVNHIYVDQQGKVLTIAQQVIKPNNYAYEGQNQIDRINSNEYTSEIYAKRMNQDITVRIADDLLDEIAGETGTVVTYKRI